MKVKPPREKSTSFFKSKKLLTYLIGFFIIIIMAMSAMDLWKGSGESYVYHGIKFTKSEDTGSWVSYINSNQVALTYNPQELENVTDVDFSLFNSVQKIYLSTDNPLVNYQSMNYFSKRLPLTPKKTLACTPESENVTECSQFPLKDCNDADDNVGVVIFKRSENFTKSLVSSTCLELEGDSDYMTKVIDKAALKMVGV